MDILAKKKCLDDIRHHKVCTKKLQKLIVNTNEVYVKKQLTKGLIWHIKRKRELRQILIDDMTASTNEDW